MKILYWGWLWKCFDQVISKMSCFIAKDLEKSAFNVLAEHRNWCPWVAAIETSSHSDSVPGWKMLLFELIPSAAPSAGQTLLEVSISVYLNENSLALTLVFRAIVANFE